jgi:glycine cleavage system H protein
LRRTGTEVRAGQTFGEVESTKSVSDVYAPISGTVVESNAALTDRPELVNDDPYGEGWMIAINASDASQFDGLMTSDQYRAFTESGSNEGG